MEIAKRMIESAAQCGVWAVKFAKRDPATFAEMTKAHPDPKNAFGSTYGEHRMALEFTPEQHAELKYCCEENGVIYSTSVSDFESLKAIDALHPEYVKIPSSRNLKWKWTADMLRQHFVFTRQWHISCGMSDAQSVHEIRNKWPKDSIFYLCTSAYPITDFQSRLALIQSMGFQGWSSHSPDILLEPVAVGLGAQYIEKHFTLDRSWKGTDHRVSIEPADLKQMVLNINRVAEAMSVTTFDLMECEVPAMLKLRWRDERRC